MDIDEIEQMIVDCENRESELKPWEAEFIQSLSEQIGERDLSENQIKKLESIWERVTH